MGHMLNLPLNITTIFMIDTKRISYSHKSSFEFTEIPLKQSVTYSALTIPNALVLSFIFVRCSQKTEETTRMKEAACHHVEMDVIALMAFNVFRLCFHYFLK